MSNNDIADNPANEDNDQSEFDIESWQPDVRIILTKGWSEVSLDPDDLDESISKMFEGLDVSDNPRLAKSVEFQVRAAYDRARSGGAVAMVQFLAKADDEPLLLSASLVIFLQELEASLAESMHELGNDRAVDVIDFGWANPAVRVSQESSAVFPGIDEAVTVLGVRYYQEIDDSPFTAILAFATPNLPFAEEFTELFDEMASTFEIHLPDELKVPPKR